LQELVLVFDDTMDVLARGRHEFLETIRSRRRGLELETSIVDPNWRAEASIFTIDDGAAAPGTEFKIPDYASSMPIQELRAFPPDSRM